MSERKGEDGNGHLRTPASFYRVVTRVCRETQLDASDENKAQRRSCMSMLNQGGIRSFFLRLKYFLSKLLVVRFCGRTEEDGGRTVFVRLTDGKAQIGARSVFTLSHYNRANVLSHK